MAETLLKAVRDKEGVRLRTASSGDGGLGKRLMCTCNVMLLVVSVCSRIILGLKDAVAHPLKNKCKKELEPLNQYGPASQGSHRESCCKSPDLHRRPCVASLLLVNFA